MELVYIHNQIENYFLKLHKKTIRDALKNLRASGQLKWNERTQKGA